MLKRIAINIALVFSIYFLPWWVTLVVFLFAIFIFEFFVESVFYAVYLDFIFSRPISSFWDFPFIFTILVLLFLLFSFYIKNKILLYEK